MADLSSVNIIACLNVLRPGSSFGWGGDGDYGNQYADIFEWRDPNTVKPTEQAILDIWPTVQASLQEETGLLNARFLTAQQVKVALLKELAKASPNTAAVKAALEALIQSDPAVTNMHTNLDALLKASGTTPEFLRAAVLLIALAG